MIFILSISAFYTLFWFIIEHLDLYELKKATAIISNIALHALGVKTTLILAGEPAIQVGRVTAHITNLCAGDLEIALITAIILSTFDRSWRNRLWGIVFAWLTIFIINPLRIIIVLAVGYYSTWKWANFTHDVLFRLTLLAVIVFYYFVWYVKGEEIKIKVVAWLLKAKEKVSRYSRL